MRNSVAIFVLIDGLGYEYVRERGFLPHLFGEPSPCRTVLGYSSAAIPCILSGKSPAETEHWSLFYYDPAGSIFRWTNWFRNLPIDRVPKLRGWFYRYLVHETRRRCSYTGYFNVYSIPLRYRSLFSYNERKDMFREGLNRGTTFFDILGLKQVPYFLATYPDPDEVSIARACERLQNGEEQIYFLYLSEMDAFLHNSCQDRAAVDRRIHWYEQQVLALYETAKRHFGDVALTVFSDHGMTPTTQSVGLMAEIARLPLRIPQDYVPFYDSTMARFWFFTSRGRDGIIRYLRGLKVGQILTDAELCNQGTYFPDHRFGQTIFLMDPGYVIQPSFMGGGPVAPAGMHGFTPADKWSDAVFLSNAEVGVTPSTILEILPFMLGVTQQTLA